LISVTESNRSPGIYSAGNGVKFVEVSDNATRRIAQRLKLNDEFDLLRPQPVRGKKFPVEPFLGAYRDSENEHLDLVLENGRLFLKHSSGKNELFWSGDQFLRSAHPVFGAVRFVYSKEGEIIGLQYAMNNVWSSLYKKLSRVRVVDFLLEDDSKLPRGVSKNHPDKENMYGIHQSFFNSLRGLTDHKLLVERALDQVGVFSKIQEQQVKIALLHDVRGVISRISNHQISPDQLRRISLLDELISKEIRSFDGKITSPNLGGLIFSFYIFPQKGEADFDAALRSIRDVWRDLDPERQIFLAQHLRLWSPLSAERLARNALSKQPGGEAELLLNELFAESFFVCPD
jgi:hypothetical protein